MPSGAVCPLRLGGPPVPVVATVRVDLACPGLVLLGDRLLLAGADSALLGLRRLPSCGRRLLLRPCTLALRAGAPDSGLVAMFVALDAALLHAAHALAP